MANLNSERLEGLTVTDTSADYYSAKATFYRDLATMLSVVFAFIIAVLLGVIAAEVTNANYAAKFNAFGNDLIYASIPLIVLFIVFYAFTAFYNHKTAEAQKAKPA
jgi:uncharacterized BrkB/YihY/UPF0761 family membrane protein